MKSRSKTKSTVSDKIADALTVKPRLDIEDDHVFGTKPQTVSREDLDSSDSEEERAISNFRKTNASLLSDLSTKYAGEVVSRKDLNSDDDHSDQESQEGYQESDDSEGTAAAVTSTKNTHTKSDSQFLSTSSNSKDTSSNSKDTSSKDYEESESDSNNSDSDESDDYSIGKFQTLASKKISSKISTGSQSPQNVTLNSNNEYSDASFSAHSDNASDRSTEEDDEEEEGIDISQIDQLPTEDFEHMKKQNIPEEVKKGMCVKNQLMLWENFLEMRIHLQRCLSTANQMPLPDKHKELKSLGNKPFNSATDTVKNSIANVLNKLLSLQYKLLENYPDTKSISNSSIPEKIPNDPKEVNDDEEIPSDTDNEEIPSDSEPEENSEKNQNEESQTRENQKPKKRKLEDYESEISTTHKKFLSFRNATIQKWNDKTRLASASTLKNTVANPILSQIDYILSDREKLIKRTQLKRTDFDIIGYEKKVETNDGNNEEMMSLNSRKEDDEYISEIYDDSDFYHQLLRELIEFKSADISDPIQLSRQWIALQQMRSKMKKKVDTKATKGRKIKYVVHNKLVNFMGPEKIVDWTDESRNELYSSLFGKKFENVEQQMNVNENGFKIMK